MKKIVSLVLTALMLAAMLTVFSVPASAAILSGELSGKITYTEATSLEDSTVQSGAKIVFNDSLVVLADKTCTVETGASVTVGKKLSINGTLIVKSGASVTVHGDLQLASNGSAALMVEPGACVTCTGNVVFAGLSAVIDIGGIFKGTWAYGYPMSNANTFTLSSGGYLEMAFKSQQYANMFVRDMSAYSPKQVSTSDSDFPFLVTVGEHNTHVFRNGACVCGEPCPHKTAKTVCLDCGADIESPETTPADSTQTVGGEGSTLSEGNLTVVVGVACSVVFLAVGALGMYLIMKKKKPATPDGESNSEE